MAIITRAGKGSPLTNTELDSNFTQLESLAATAKGKVLQVLQIVKLNTFAMVDISPVSVPGLTITITPSSVTSKILIMANISGGQPTNGSGAGGSVYRGNLKLFAPLLPGDRMAEHISFGSNNNDTRSDGNSKMFLDSPNTAGTIVYSFRVRVAAPPTACYINRHSGDGNDITSGFRRVSTMTLFEIGA